MVPKTKTIFVREAAWPQASAPITAFSHYGHTQSLHPGWAGAQFNGFEFNEDLNEKRPYFNPVGRKITR